MKMLIIKLKFALLRMTGRLPETSGDIVDRLDWADREIEETEDKLLSLYHRLIAGNEAMIEAQKDAERIIKRHEEILEKSKDRQVEFSGKAQVTKDFLDKLDADIKK